MLFLRVNDNLLILNSPFVHVPIILNGELELKSSLILTHKSKNLLLM